MWTNPQEAAGLVIFTEEILHEKLNFLCSESINQCIFLYGDLLLINEIIVT